MKNERIEFEKKYVAARKALIASEFKSLNNMQKRAVLKTEGPLLILAGAGSGKTTVLINRIANILKYGKGSDSDFVPSYVGEAELAVLEAGSSDEASKLAVLDAVEPWRVIAITFTNKAATELKERLVKVLGDSANDVWARTFHSACVRILRSYADRLGYPQSFTIYDVSDRNAVLKRILSDLELDEKSFPPKEMIAKFDSLRDEYISPKEFSLECGSSPDPRKQTISRLYTRYMEQLFTAGAMDFSDLLYNTVRLFKEHPDVLERYQKQFKYVLVDEYQDTNKLQYEFASMLAKGSGNICVVGDDNQSIYKFRGATIENILDFENEYKSKGCTVINLEQNYRSTGHILSAANKIIERNVNRKEKNLWTDAGDGEKLVLQTCITDSEEAYFVASRIMDCYKTDGAYKNSAILYRMNALTNRIEYALKQNGIPYRVYGGMKFFDRAEVKDMLAYLCIVNSPNDDLRLSRIINTPARGIGAKTVDDVRELSLREDVSMMDIVKRANEHLELSRSAVKLINFSDMISELRERSKTLRLDEFYDLLIERTGYIRELEGKKGDEAAGKIENVRELRSNILAYLQSSEDGTLSGFLDEIALYTDMDNYDADSDCVVLMTIHSSKGLEFENVFLVGMEDGIFPGSRSVGSDDELEEERRLCYVALTRAKRKLYLSHAIQRMLFGRTTSNRPSRFLGEIPKEHIELPPTDKRSTPAQKAYTTSSPSQRVAEKHKPTIAPKKTPTTLPDFSIGDTVEHKAFGKGQLVKLTRMGGDALIEIEFDTEGKKRLMLRAASEHMRKSEGSI